MTPVFIALIVVVAIMAGAFLGGILRGRLPKHHLDSETKDMAKAGIAFLSTLSALVLGLIIGTAKNSFDTKSEEVQSAAAKIAVLDENLRQMGSVADPARELLRQIVASRITTLWGGDGAPTGKLTPKPGLGIRDMRNTLLAIAPTDEAQRTTWLKALQSVDELRELRSLAIAQSGSSITLPLLGLLVFWLALITLGLNIFAPRNWTIYAINLVMAVSSAAAIYLILEMDQPFSGFIRISDAPFRAVLMQLGQ